METVERLQAEFTAKFDEFVKASVEINKRLDDITKKGADFGKKTEVSGAKAKAAFRDVARTLGSVNPLLGKVAWQFAAIDDAVTPLYGHFRKTGDTLLAWVKVHPVLAGGIAAVTLALAGLTYALLSVDPAMKKYKETLASLEKASESYRAKLAAIAVDSNLLLKPAEETMQATLAATEEQLRQLMAAWRDSEAAIHRRVYTDEEASKRLRQSFDLWGGPEAIRRTQETIAYLKRVAAAQEEVRDSTSQAGQFAVINKIVDSKTRDLALSEKNVLERIKAQEIELQILQLLQEQIRLKSKLSELKTATPWQPWTKGGYHAPPLGWEAGGKTQFEEDRPAEAMAWLSDEADKASEKLQEVSDKEDLMASRLWEVGVRANEIFQNIGSAAAGAFTMAITGAESWGQAVTGILDAVASAFIGTVAKMFFEWVAAKMTEMITGNIAAYSGIPWVGLALGIAGAAAAIAMSRTLASKHGGRSFAEGGLALRPVVATVGDAGPGGEVIAPRSKFEELFAHRSGGSSTYIFELDGREFCRGILPHFSGEVRRIGIRGM